MAYQLSGTIFDTDGSTDINAGVIVYIYNKTNNLMVSGHTAGFTDAGELTTTADGAYSVNLDEMTGGSDAGDEVFVMARSDEKTAMSRHVVGAGTTGTENLTMQKHEPIMNYVNFLRAFLNDRNTTRNDTRTMVMPENDQVNDLSKNDYPHITVKEEEGEGKRAGLTSTAEESEVELIVTVQVWGVKKGDSQIITISGYKYHAPKLLDFIVNEIRDANRTWFYHKPQYEQSPQINQYYGFKRIETSSQSFDETTGIMRKSIRIKFNYIRQD